MNAPVLEQLSARCIAAPASLERVELAVTSAEKRLRRAREKADAAEAELDASVQWLDRMRNERKAFIDGYVGPQGIML